MGHGWVWTGLAVLVGLVVLCSVFGWLGRLWWPLELLSHFRVQYAAILGVGAIAAFLGKQAVLAGWTAVAALLNLLCLLPAAPARPPHRSTGRRLRALVMNVYVRNDRYHRFLELLRNESPDVAVVVEVTPEWARALQSMRDDYPFTHVLPREDGFGIALLSRLPLEHLQVYRLDGIGIPSVLARVNLDGDSLTVIGTHPPGPMTRWRAWARNHQLAALGALAAQQDGGVMILGDLNITPWSPFFRTFLKQAGLRDSRIGHGLQPTWPTTIPWLRIPIDHCLVSEEVIVHTWRRGPHVGSDHFPVMVEVSIASDRLGRKPRATKGGTAHD